MRNSRILIACALVLAVACLYITPACFSTSEEEARDKVEQIEHNLNLAFTAVSEAQLAGAEVSTMSEKLETATEQLTKANNALRIGDYEYAVLLATQSNETLNHIADDAIALRVEAELASKNRILDTALMSGAGLGLLLVVSLVGWKFLNKRYLNQILKARPEVGKLDES